MRSRLLILCPGQGGQHADMYALARSSPRAAALLDGLRLPADGDIFANRRAQPAIVAAGVAMWEALRGDAPPPALVAGYSIGELTAYGVAGALDARDTVALAGQRAALMDACVREAQAMAAITGPHAAALPPLLAPHGFTIAIQTGEDSVIAGGPAANVGALEAALTGGSPLPAARVQVLPVAVASHTPAMGDAVAPFAGALRAASWRASTAPVVAGIDAALVRVTGAGIGGGAGAGAEDAVAHLARQLAEPIRWMDCMDAFAEQGITAALELGPGSALSRMLAGRHPGIECRSASDFRTLDGIKRWLERIS